jgi:hypothetical protein
MKGSSSLVASARTCPYNLDKLYLLLCCCQVHTAAGVVTVAKQKA